MEPLVRKEPLDVCRALIPFDYCVYHEESNLEYSIVNCQANDVGLVCQISQPGLA